MAAYLVIDTDWKDVEIETRAAFGVHEIASLNAKASKTTRRHPSSAVDRLKTLSALGVRQWAERP